MQDAEGGGGSEEWIMGIEVAGWKMDAWKMEIDAGWKMR